MIVKNLKAKNVGVLNDIDIDFQTGFNVFVGGNGQGKSTIMKPLALGLVNYTETTLSEMIQWHKDKAEFSFEFEHNDKYYYEMSIAKTNTRKLIINGSEELKNSEVSAHLATKFDPALTKASVISLQSDSTDIVNASDSERRERFKKIYDLDFSEQVKEVEVLRQEVELELEELNKKIVILENKEYQIKDIPELPFSEADLLVKQNDIEKLRNQKTKLELEKERVVEYQKAIAELHKSQSSLETDLESYKKDKVKKEVESQDAVTNLEHIRIDLARIDDDKKSKQDVLEAELDKLKTELSTIRFARLPRFNNEEKKNLEFRYAELRASMKANEASLKACESGHCHSCGQEIGEDHKKNLELEKVDIEAELKEVTEKLQTENGKEAEYENKKLEKESAEKTRDQIQNKIATKEKELETLQETTDLKKKNLLQEKERLNTRIPEIDNEIRELGLKLESLKNRIQELCELIQTKSKQVQPVDENELKNIGYQITGMESEIDAYKRVVDNIERIKKENEQAELDKEKDAERIDALKAEQNQLLEDINKLKEGETIFKRTFPNYILSSMIAEVEEGMNEFLDEVYGGRYHVILDEKKDGIGLYYGSAKANVKNASGAEKDLINLGLKYAFTKMSGLKTLWLDEVDKFMSTDQAEKAFAYIYNKFVSGDLEQIFVISHNDEVKALLENMFEAKTFYLDKGEVTS